MPAHVCKEQASTRRKIKMLDLFAALGFHWDREKIPHQVPTHSLDRVTFHFHRMLTTYVWDASVLEGNPFTFPEVKTLLEGVTVGGHKISDQEQVLNLAESSKQLLALVKAGKFELNKRTFIELHGLVAKNEALEWGHFRGEGSETNYTPDVGLGPEGRYTPLPTLPGAPELNRVFSDGLLALEKDVENAFEKAAAFFLFGALQKFFFDGNKRTSRFMMNGVLMSAGIDAISIPAANAQDFNEKMVRFYVTKDATEMMAFLVSCHPEAITIQQNNT
jgi:Fic family protein